jgi:short-subunit dehydrogenase
LADFCLITGASSGLGKALAYHFADQKIPLLLSARDQEALSSMHKELSQKTSVEILTLDLGKPEDRKKLLTKIHEKTPDLVFNCAGFGLYGNALNHRTEESLNMVEINVQALLEISLEAARALQNQKKTGTIVNISSAASYFSYPTFAVYAASKGFVRHFSEAFNTEMKPYGIHVLCACPGQFESGFRMRASKGHPQKKSAFVMSTDTAVQEILKQIEKKKTVYLFTWPYRLLVGLSYLLPNKIYLSLLKKTLKSRT